ncbi:hypothetical protein GCM10027055_05290 [Janibacter alkaliphilus]|uniref:AcrR family transcriptional regulator n=1 Tax=Janibacter alkaliphilus TaxID=1069963 RepID=A0A852X8Q8_9MICO|nr:TetR/AcrR family transcriptional regulator [Janibacter alkaliphilus]NYG37143.1 AcrR family transcriptional regulator [Janibacter alkaliphilus]
MSTTSAGPTDPELPSFVDPARVGTQPATARGQRTRDALIAAARKVFERDGYVESRLVDIVAEARCSIGSFYTWFEGKDEVFAAVVQQAQNDMLHPGIARVESTDDPVEIIAASNRAYFAAYERNARLNQLLDQVAAVDPSFRSLRRARSQAFVERNARAIRDLQARGLADQGVDPTVAAMALSGMVSRLAQGAFLPDGPYVIEVAPEDLVSAATRLWTNALGLTQPQLGR